MYREELEAQRKKEDYQRRHNAGETEEAKRQLAQVAYMYCCYKFV